ncbi:hypothetical protein LC609_27395 [Nostoc sp. XA013]|nr:hypothetical protein [Nostoc sp. XA013]
MLDESLTIKPRSESINKNLLILESNLAVEVKIDNDEIKFPPNHRVFGMFDWQLEAYNTAQAFDSKIKVAAENWNSLCMQGSFRYYSLLL